MGNWINQSLRLGTIKQGQKLNFNFESREPLDISEIRPSCASCTTIKGYDKSTKLLSVEYKAGKFPPHLELQGRRDFDSNKSVKVIYTNGTAEDLFFSIKVYK